MITKNINGQAISQAFKDALNQGIVNFSFKFAKTNPLDVITERASISLGAGMNLSDTEGFSIGSVFSNSLSATIYEEGSDSLDVGDVFTVRVGVELSEGTYEYIQVGKFIVTEKETWLGRSNISARGFALSKDINQAAGLVTGIVSASSLASTLANKLGVTINLNGLSGNVHITNEQTVIQALEALATYLGCFIVETNDGSLEVNKFSSAATYTLPSEYVTKAPQLSKEPYTLDGLTVIADAEYAYGTGKLRLELPGATQAVANTIWANVKDYTFTPGSIDVAIIDPRVTPADVISATLDGVTYTMPAQGISATYDGGYFGAYSSAGVSDTAEESQRQTGLVARLEGAALAAEEAAAVASATGQHFWTDTQGAHITDNTQEDWTAEWVKNDHGELANPTDAKPWFNQLVNSLGTLIRSGLLNLVSITRSAISFFDGEGNAETNIVARFGADGAQIGKTSSNHITITANGLGIYSGDTYANVNGVDVGQAASNAATAKSDAATAKSDAASAKALVTASVKNADVEYYQSTSATELKGGSWQTKAPTWKDGTYIWTRTKWTQNGGETTYSTATCITGNTGAKGDAGAKGATGSTGATGAKGKGVSSITELYYCSNSATAPAKPTATVTTNAANQYDKWNKQPATWTSTYKYYYTCSEILYDDNTRAWSDVVANNGMTTANSTAATAKSTADTAKTTADNAKTAADEAKSVANATKQNFWADTSGVHVSTQANTAAGTFNSLFNANGLLFRKASNNLLSLTGSALNFYDGSGNAATNVQASFGTTTQLGKTADYHYYGTSTTMGIYPGGNNTAANAVFYVNNTPSVRIGNQAADKANVYITNAGMQIRDNATAQGRFLINQSVSGWVDWYGTGTAPFSNVCQIDGGSATAPLNFAGNLSFNNGKVRIYSSGQIAVNTMRCFDYLGFRVNANTNSYALKEILKTEYYGTETATGSDGIEIATPNSQWSSPIIKTSPGDKNGQAVLLGGGALTIVGSGEFPTNFFNTRTFAATSETLHLGSDGATYIYTNGNTIANRKTYAFSTAGNLTLPQKQDSKIYTGSTYTETTPSANKYEGGCCINDAAGATAAYFRGLHQANGNRGLQLEAKRSISGAYKYHTLNLTINTSGNAVVGLGGTNVAAAWRSAIGANNASNINAGTLAIARGGTGATGVTKTTSGVVTALSGYTIAEQSMTQWGKVVTLRLRVTSTNATSGSRQVATVASGYRPTYLTVGQDWEPTRACYVDTGGQVYIKGAMNAGVTEIMSFMYLIP